MEKPSVAIRREHNRRSLQVNSEKQLAENQREAQVSVPSFSTTVDHTEVELDCCTTKE